MAGAVIGGLLGAAFGSTLATWGLVSSAGLGWLFGASIGSLFDQPSMDFGSSSPNYSFSEIHNTKSQMLPIPICYGRVRVAGNVFMQQFYDDKKQKMDMFVGLSQGPIHRVISVYANEHLLFGEDADAQAQEIKYWILKEETHLVPGEENEEITEYSWVEATKEEYDVWEGRKERRDPNGNVITVDLKECSCDIHLGTPDQLKDDRESGEHSYGRVAYLGATLKVQEGLTGNPTITTEFEGREVWTPSGIRYTANPVWCIVDLLTNTDYGVGIPLAAINIPAAEDAAAYCDELLDGRPRYSLNYIIDQQRPAPDILRDMLMCFDGYIREREQITICVNRPVSTPDAYLVVNDVAKQGTFKWWQKGREETYNRVILEWVDPENHYERTSTPFEAQADVEARGLYERNISLLGVTDPYQAARLGEQALHVAQTINNFCSFTVSVCDWDFEVGDVIGLTESAVTGWDRTWFHVLHMQDDAQNEECTVTLVEYDGSTYVDTPSQVPATTDNPDPPTVLDDYTNLLLTDVGSQQADGTYVPKVRVRYTPPSAEMKEHVVSWWHNDEETSEKKVSPAVKDVLISEGITTGKTLTVRVWGTDINGKPRTGVLGQIVPGHDDIAPSPPTSLTTEGWFGEIILNWINPTTNEDGSPCRDLAYIEVWASSTDDRETAVKIGEVNGTTFRHHLGSFVGRYYWIRAVDTSGNVSQWNAESGVPGYSDMENADDFWDRIATDQVLQALDELQEPIDSLAETEIFNALSDYDDAIEELLQKRAQDKIDQNTITGALADYDDFVWSFAVIKEEQRIREEEDEALASQILTISAMLGDPNNPGEGTIYAALAEEKTTRATQDEALAKNISTLEAVIGDPWDPEAGTVYAAIRDEEQARANAVEAVASQVDTVVAKIGDPSNPASGSVYAAIKSETEARVSADEVVAQEINTLQTSVDGNTSSIQQTMSSVDGMKSKWAVKTTTNNHVGGLEMVGSASSIDMIFNVDTFLVQTPNTFGGTPPFMIGTVDGRTRTVIRDAFIQDAAISRAKIKDAAVGTLKIDGNAVTVPDAAQNTARVEVPIGGVASLVSLSCVGNYGQPRLMVFTASADYGGGWMECDLVKSGVVIQTIVLRSSTAVAMTGIALSWMDTAGGTATYRVRCRCISAAHGHWIEDSTLFALSVKR
ncbi:phage tail protein [Dethiosulfovibrio sp. F2B]|uniref:phage tail protein n=1 Tax=Dethiosulfovibrio faecalis TaxID=2720018 RepID=UPI001F3D0146|nr:phage tail protein [Dethiosulfovibrio faecalis]MCF4152625.1 phage tail protein [Dethiosulfovibrio faecalis]